MWVYLRVKEGWQPWANTIAYWKLDGNLNDSSNNNRDLTARTWTISYWTLPSGEKYWIFNSTIVTHSTNYIWLSSWTILAWVYFNSLWWTILVDNQNANNSDYYYAVCLYESATSYRPIYMRSSSYKATAPWTWWWFLFAVTQDGSGLKYYKNWDAPISISTTNFIYESTHNQWCVWWLARWTQNYNLFDWYLSNIILENKVRTAEEISDYYNQTKALYGLN